MNTYILSIIFYLIALIPNLLFKITFDDNKTKVWHILLLFVTFFIPILNLTIAIIYCMFVLGGFTLAIMEGSFKFRIRIPNRVIEFLKKDLF